MGRVVVLRLLHRAVRDVRLTTHCALVARALGADAFLLSGDNDSSTLESVRKLVQKWGGNFTAEYCCPNAANFIKNFEGVAIHLTMYGLPVQKEIAAIRKTMARQNLLVVVGSQKVPGQIYQICDYNIAVTNQPHSEVGALSVFLHMLFEGKELETDFKNAKIRVKPSLRGKIVEKT